MKLAFFLSITLMAFVSQADVNQGISVEKESGLEVDHDTMQIKDLDAESKMAKEQAAVQEQISKEAQVRFDRVKTQKTISLEKSKAELANYQTQIKEAEKNNKKYKEETEKLSSDIRKIEESTDKARRAAKDAVDIAAAGKEELQLMRDRKLKVEQENMQALTAEQQAEGKMLRLKDEYGRLIQNIKELEKRVLANQEEVKRKNALIAVGAQKVGDLQTKEAQLKTALGAKPVADERRPNSVSTEKTETTDPESQNVEAPQDSLSK